MIEREKIATQPLAMTAVNRPTKKADFDEKIQSSKT